MRTAGYALDAARRDEQPVVVGYEMDDAGRMHRVMESYSDGPSPDGMGVRSYASRNRIAIPAAEQAALSPEIVAAARAARDARVAAEAERVALGANQEARRAQYDAEEAASFPMRVAAIRCPDAADVLRVHAHVAGDDSAASAYQARAEALGATYSQDSRGRLRVALPPEHEECDGREGACYAEAAR